MAVLNFISSNYLKNLINHFAWEEIRFVQLHRRWIKLKWQLIKHENVLLFFFISAFDESFQYLYIQDDPLA